MEQRDTPCQVVEDEQRRRRNEDRLRQVGELGAVCRQTLEVPHAVVADGADEPAGVQVAGIELGDPEGRVVHEPTHPLADEDGNVRYPDVDMASQMSQLIMAQRGYQASAAVVDRARESYQTALQIGKN